jgi:serine/threonine-protein kinase
MAPIARAGRYELLVELGRGAMGVVYRAHDPVIGRTVAVKTLRVVDHGSGLSPDELLRRFHTEARAAGLLSHPNIVAVYDAGKEESLFYITMELVEGKSLQELLGERHPFPLARVLRVMQQACSALEFAHQHNVIHRDIKPANLILTPDDNLKITDFGTAKILQFQTVQTGQVLGTPSYMSPEQIKGRAVDGRSDIFSLGGVLYELVTGHKPFSGDSVTAVIYKIVSEEPIPPRELDSSIHPGLSAVILRALAKSPTARFQSCVEFFDALQNHREYQPTGSSMTAPAPAGQSAAAEPSDAPVMAARSTFPMDPAPAKHGGSVWLALVLLAIIAVAGYKVWPPLQALWLRSQPEPVPVLPLEQPQQESAAPVAPAVPAMPVAPNVLAPAPPAAPNVPAAPARPAAPEAPSSIDGPPSVPVVTPPVPPRAPVEASSSAPPAALEPRPAVNQTPSPARATPRPVGPSVSPAVAEWRQRIVRALEETGASDKVRVVAAGNTLTLVGKLDIPAHRRLLELLQGVPASVQIVDHIEFDEPEPAEGGSSGSPPEDAIPQSQP